MEGGSAASGYHAIRIKSDVLSETEHDGNRTQDKFCVRPGSYCGLVLLFSTRTGEPLALLNDGVLQHMRVGADAAIGVRCAARSDARVLGVLGSGGMARSHLEAVLGVRPLERVQVWSPTRANREAYAAQMSAAHGLEVLAVEEPREVFRGADVLMACTDSAAEIVVGDWLEPGTHVTAVGGRLDARARARLDVWLRLGTAPARWTTRRGGPPTSTSPTSHGPTTRCGRSTRHGRGRRRRPPGLAWSPSRTCSPGLRSARTNAGDVLRARQHPGRAVPRRGGPGLRARPRAGSGPGAADGVVPAGRPD